MTGVPDRSEAAEYYFTYIDQVPAGDICAILESQASETLALLSGIGEERSRYRYESGKWSIREVVNHLNDGERLFAFRAFWFARGFDSPLPSFDQDIAVAGARADDRSLSDLSEEFRTVRASSLTFFKSLSPADFARRGVASDNPFSVRALAYVTAGHVTHHLKVLRERYQV